MSENIFQKIIKKKITANILYEDDKVIAIYDIRPISKGHFLVIPKGFSENLYSISDEDYNYLMDKARGLAIIESKKNNWTGFKMQVNNGKSSGQEIFHTHVHIIPSSE